MSLPAIPEHVDLIVTHGGCHDGFTAEWLLHRLWPRALCYPGAYGEDITDLVYRGNINRGNGTPAVAVMADFSYQLPEMLRLAEAWDRIIVLDHHASAIDRLDGNLPPNVECVFDVTRSGAGITADWLNVRHNPIPGASDRHGLVDYVEDRDLWRFAHPESKEAIQYLIAATPHTYAEWDLLDYRLRFRFDECVAGGRLVGRYHRIIVDELVDAARPVVIDGHDTLIVPSPYLCGSDVAGELARLSPSGIGAYIRMLPDRNEYGLRSTDDGPDVAQIAERLGGGGHPHASGFRVQHDGSVEVIGSPHYK